MKESQNSGVRMCSCGGGVRWSGKVESKIKMILREVVLGVVVWR